MNTRIQTLTRRRKRESEERMSLREWKCEIPSLHNYIKKHYALCEWSGITCLLSFDMGDEFITWIKMLYSSPLARVLTNKTISDSFNPQRGTSQGCPLSPFLLTVEPLAETIRSNSCMQGFSTSNAINKISLYADDILLYITQPQWSLPVILKSITIFKVHFEKSELMPIGLKDFSIIHCSPIKFSTKKIVYLHCGYL